MPRRTAATLSLPLALLFTFSLSIVLALIFLSLTALAGIGLAFGQLNRFSQAAQTTPVALISTVVSGWHKTPVQTQGRKNILVLGTDSLATRGDAPHLTDTILIISLDLQTGKSIALSLPRDLYSEKYQRRINALYAMAKDQDLIPPEQLPTQEISELTGVPLHHTVIVSLDDVAELIELVGGVEVDVKEGFIDYQFPRTDVDVTRERDPAKLYETVEFKPGKQTMNGETALKYIRSRKSQGSEGSDNARSVRQQQVIEAVLQKITTLRPESDLDRIARLYHYYQVTFAQYFSPTEAVATARVLLPLRDSITFTGQSLSVFPENPAGVIYHPPTTTTNGAWLYKIRNLQNFRQEVQTKLELSDNVQS